MARITIWASGGYVTPGANVAEHYGCYEDWTLGDNRVNEFAATPSLEIIDKTHPELILEISKKAVELFGGNHLLSFIQENLKYNRFKSDLHFEFLKDTIEFIKTGKRSMSISTWQSLLIIPTGKMSTTQAAKTTYSMNPSEYSGATIQKWLTQENGLADLTYSMRIIFGRY
jgi:hypothetical protein